MRHILRESRNPFPMLKILVSFLALVAVAMVIISTTSASAEEPHPIGYTFEIDGGDSIPAWFSEAGIEKGVAAWNGLSSQVLNSYAGITTNRDNACTNGGQTDGKNVIKFINKPLSGWLGRTCRKESECDIVLNVAYGQFDLYTVVAHEVGHCIGMVHDDDDTQNIMYPGYGIHGPLEHPSADDIAQFCSRYNCDGGTPTATVSATTTATATASASATSTSTATATPTATKTATKTYRRGWAINVARR